MDCATARNLISLEVDGMASYSDVELLHEHLAACGSCAAYRDSIAHAIALVDEHFLEVTVEADNRNLDQLVAHAIAAEQSHCKHDTGLFAEILRLVAGNRSSRALSYACSLSVAALLLVASQLFVDYAVGAGICVADQHRIGHIESFTAETDSQGRVYAAVIERNSTFLDEGECSK